MRSLSASRIFAATELVGVALAAVLVVLQPFPVAPEFGGWPLIFATIPGLLRVLAGRPPFRLTGFDFLLLVFLATAGVGVWAAYDPVAAWRKFWILLAGVFVFYALAGQPPESRRILTVGLSGLGVAVTIYFLAATNWQEQTSDLGFINRLTAALADVQPGSAVQFLNKNLFGGLLALLAPFVPATALHAYRERRRLELGGAVVAGLCLALGLLLSSSRGAWLALATALSLWLFGEICRRLAHGRGWRPEVVYTAVVVVGLACAAIALSLHPGGLLGLADHLPGERSGDSRLAVFHQAWELIHDYPLTGGGLNAFAGLYSRYALVITPFVFSYSHNFYLDVILEQGLFGGLAVGWIYLGSLWRLIRFRPSAEAPEAGDRERLRLATLAAFVVVGLHGLIDSALYGERGTPLLFLLPGLSLMLTDNAPFQWCDWAKSQAAAAAVILVGLVGFAVFARAQVYADLGAVEMAKVELAGFPEVSWDRAYNPAEFLGARAYLEQARRLDPHNRTAAHRLGLLAFQAGDCEQAIVALELAAGADPPHGLAKPLGYCYTWLGDFERAGPLLLRIPEARYELNIYGLWWGTQNRPDLAERATYLEHWLARAGAPLDSDPLAAP